MSIARFSLVALLGASACGTPTQTTIETPRGAADSARATGENGSNLASVVAVVPVKDHEAAMAWYRSWIGREADLVPTDGVAEWNLAGNGWLQVSLDPDHAGGTTVVIGVNDIEAQRSACGAVGVTVSEVQDYGFIKIVEAQDPDGNKVVFVQETGGP